jgi:hypothetical protein
MTVYYPPQYSDLPPPANKGDSVQVKSGVIAARAITMVKGQHCFLTSERGPYSIQTVQREEDGRWSYTLDLGDNSRDHRFLADKFERIDRDQDWSIATEMMGPEPWRFFGS